jgi:hypothetical protein
MTRLFILSVAVIGLLAAPIRGHETDQYTVPIGREFADLRYYFSTYFQEALDAAVTKTNRRIRRAMRWRRPESEVRRLQSPEVIAEAVVWEFPPVMIHVETLEAALRAPQVQREYPGLVVAHLPVGGVYEHWALLFDPTKLVRLRRSSTIMIDGVYLGTDKIVHFVHMGYIYFTTYRSAIRSGVEEAEAVRRAVAAGAGPNPLSEGGLLGMLSTGVWSNADLAADYAGFKFYRNLTEAVSLAGEQRPPLLIRSGAYWVLNEHVRGGADFFSGFVSPHWDEALNPNRYDFHVGFWLPEQIKARCPDLLAWYADAPGRTRSREEFLQLARELSTYYGENYGHAGDPETMVGIVKCCFEKVDDPQGPLAGNAETEDEETRDPFQRTELWRAVQQRDRERVQQLLDLGAEVNAADIDGETPLHCAVRMGLKETVRQLLERGADPNAKALYGNTPLHLAARSGAREIVHVLLAAGANPRVSNEFKRIPHEEAKSAKHDDIAADLRVPPKRRATPTTLRRALPGASSGGW